MLKKVDKGFEKMTKLVIYDIKDIEEPKKEGYTFFGANQDIKNCKGCFSCWIKTPGECKIGDCCKILPKHMSECEEIVIISPLIYGCYSHKIKTVIERAIPYMLPFFKKVNEETHHKMRYANAPIFTVCFYGEATEEEKETARELVKANAINFGAKKFDALFYKDEEEIRGEYFE